MAITQRLVNHLAGALRIEHIDDSNPKHGARVTLIIPNLLGEGDSEK